MANENIRNLDDLISSIKNDEKLIENLQSQLSEKKKERIKLLLRGNFVLLKEQKYKSFKMDSLEKLSKIQNDYDEKMYLLKKTTTFNSDKLAEFLVKVLNMFEEKEYVLHEIVYEVTRAIYYIKGSPQKIIDRETLKLIITKEEALYLEKKYNNKITSFSHILESDECIWPWLTRDYNFCVYDYNFNDISYLLSRGKYPYIKKILIDLINIKIKNIYILDVELFSLMIEKISNSKEMYQNENVKKLCK